MDPDDIASRITPKTKLIIINSPQNPTGSVMTEKEISTVYTMAREHNLFILSDEIYRLMSYDCIPASPSVFDHCRERTIIMTGFSKSFAMTGWRLGYMIGPSELASRLGRKSQNLVPVTREMVDVILEETKKQGYIPDSCVAGDDVLHGARPEPFLGRIEAIRRYPFSADNHRAVFSVRLRPADTHGERPRSKQRRYCR